MNNVVRASWERVNHFVEQVAKEARLRSFSGVYGIPRGGLPLAVWISHRAKLPLLMAPDSRALIVDDIADTGETLHKYSGSNFIATMFYHRQSSFVPDLWCFEKKDDWVVFPWEE